MKIGIRGIRCSSQKDCLLLQTYSQTWNWFIFSQSTHTSGHCRYKIVPLISDLMKWMNFSFSTNLEKLVNYFFINFRCHSAGWSWIYSSLSLFLYSYYLHFLVVSTYDRRIQFIKYKVKDQRTYLIRNSI